MRNIDDIILENVKLHNENAKLNIDNQKRDNIIHRINDKIKEEKNKCNKCVFREDEEYCKFLCKRYDRLKLLYELKKGV